ncbi:hypothetical protein [Flavitalea sp.]|nr:hypothetical protein [Flavitalea sp.]
MWYLLKKRKVPVIYLGANTDTELVFQYCSRQPVTELYFYLITNLVNCNIDRFVTEFSQQLADKEFSFGGTHVCILSFKPVNVTILNSTRELLSFVNRRIDVESSMK